jgi:putative transposase
MPRKPRIEMIGYHHVLNRGVNKQAIFLDAQDNQMFLQILCQSCKEYQVEVHSYCLVDNHYHLLIKTADENLSKFMRSLNSSYAIYFN